MDERVKTDIDRFGWHVVLIEGDDIAPPWAHSIGLLERFAHPEIIACGIDPGALHALVNHIGERVRDGDRFADGERREGILERYACGFRRVAQAWVEPFLGNALWHHQNQSGLGSDPEAASAPPPFEALQCLWPDEQGHLPWDPGFAQELRDEQPLLYQPDAADALSPAFADLLRTEGVV